MHLSEAGIALFGGLLIGGAASGLLLLNGQIAGISNITAGLFSQRGRDWSWRLAFVLGMLAGGAALAVFYPQAFGPLPFRSPVLIATAGLLVGLGAQLANGCTSGHGVCGLGRRSLRSLVATLTFMGAGIATVYVSRLGLGGGNGVG